MVTEVTEGENLYVVRFIHAAGGGRISVYRGRITHHIRLSWHDRRVQNPNGNSLLCEQEYVGVTLEWRHSCRQKAPDIRSHLDERYLRGWIRKKHNVLIHYSTNGLEAQVLLVDSFTLLSWHSCYVWPQIPYMNDHKASGCLKSWCMTLTSQRFCRTLSRSFLSSESGG